MIIEVKTIRLLPNGARVMEVKTIFPLPNGTRVIKTMPPLSNDRQIMKIKIRYDNHTTKSENSFK